MFKRTHHLIFITFLSTLLFGCDGGGGDGTPADDGGGGQPLAATPSLSFAQSKVFRFSWTDEADATYYRLLENPDGTAGFTQVGGDIPQGIQTLDHIVPLYARVNAQYILQSCNAMGCTDSAALAVSGTLVAAIGYFKASNSEAGDYFGYALSLSADGNTLAVGAYAEDSNATGIGGNGANNGAENAGAVYVFTRSGSSIWTEQAYIKASNTGANDRFGNSVSLAADGNTLAVGASDEASNATGIDGNGANNGASSAGAVYVFTRSGSGIWTEQAYVKASNTGASDRFGNSVSLAADGNTLAVGARYEASNATGIDGNGANNGASSAGAVYVFTRSGSGIWTEQAYVKASNTGDRDWFGLSVSLAADGNTLAVGALLEDSNATGIDGNGTNNGASDAGAVYVFTRSGITWTEQAYLKASNTGAGDGFGNSISLAADGNTLAVGALLEDSNATGIDGNDANNGASDAGAVYVFTRSGSSWSQQAYLKASNTGSGDRFASFVSLAADGNTLAVGAIFEDSNTTGIDGDGANSGAVNAGAVYVFTRSGSSWFQQAYVKASNTSTFDQFGSSVSLAADGTLVVGAYGEASNATGVNGVNGDQTDNSASRSGAVYLY